jgi:hypothetical protein
MALWMHIIGWIFLGLNTLCLIRLGVLPVIFFAKNYALYSKIFWVSLIVTSIFLGSEYMLLQILLTLNVE